MTMLMDSSQGTAKMFMHDKKTVMKMNGDTFKTAAGLASKFLGNSDTPPAKPKATGQKVKIGDWDTEVYTWESKIGQGKFYVCKDFPKFSDLTKAMDRIAKSMSNPMSAMFPSYSEFPGMIVKSEMTMMGNTSTTELISAKEQPVSEEGSRSLKTTRTPRCPPCPPDSGSKRLQSEVICNLTYSRKAAAPSCEPASAALGAVLKDIEYCPIHSTFQNRARHAATGSRLGSRRLP